MYISRQKIMHLCIDLKSCNEDRLRTHIQNADPVDFLMLYLSTSMSALWTRVLLPSGLVRLVSYLAPPALGDGVQWFGGPLSPSNTRTRDDDVSRWQIPE